MTHKWLSLVVFMLMNPSSLFALEQEDICRVEVLRNCQARLKADLITCNLSSASSAEPLNCEQPNLSKCQDEAAQAACGGTVKPQEPFVAPIPQEESGRTQGTLITRQQPAPVQHQTSQQGAAASPSSPSSNPNAATTASAQSEASADIAQCTQIQSEAQRCCGNPLSCASPAQAQKAAQIQQQIKNGPSPGQSIPNYCAQLGQLSSDSGSYNQDMAGLCYGPQSSCSRTCQSLAQKYYSRASNCSDATCSIFQNAAEQLSSMAGNCDMRRAKAVCELDTSPGGTPI